MTDELEALLKQAEEHDRKATPGPWRKMLRWDEHVVPEGQEDRPLGASIYPDDDRDNHAHPIVSVNLLRASAEYREKFPHARTDPAQAAADAAFIAWARTAVPALVKALRESAAERHRLGALVTEAQNYIDPDDQPGWDEGASAKRLACDLTTEEMGKTIATLRADLAAASRALHGAEVRRLHREERCYVCGTYTAQHLAMCGIGAALARPGVQEAAKEGGE